MKYTSRCHGLKIAAGSARIMLAEHAASKKIIRKLMLVIFLRAEMFKGRTSRAAV